MVGYVCPSDPTFHILHFPILCTPVTPVKEGGVPSRERTEHVTEDRMTTLFFEIMSGLPRQGPGDITSTRRALQTIPNVGSQTRLVDIGCGTGSQTRVLLEYSPARVLAIDTIPPLSRS
jgi:hypothetical protein